MPLQVVIQLGVQD